LAYINQSTKAFIKTVLVCRQLYGAGSKFDEITVNPNNFLKTLIQNYMRHYFEAARFTQS
tara:strand:+ start:780 stop:959 length:180 start_codon:yes stop_codon:yes gene_type:complete